MRRNYLTGRDGDRINAVLAAAGYNFSLLLRWFEELLPALSLILWHAPLGRLASPNPVPQNFLHGRLNTRPNQFSQPTPSFICSPACTDCAVTIGWPMTPETCFRRVTNATIAKVTSFLSMPSTSMTHR